MESSLFPFYRGNRGSLRNIPLSSMLKPLFEACIGGGTTHAKGVLARLATRERVLRRRQYARPSRCTETKTLAYTCSRRCRATLIIERCETAHEGESELTPVNAAREKRMLIRWVIAAIGFVL